MNIPHTVLKEQLRMKFYHDIGKIWFELLSAQGAGGEAIKKLAWSKWMIVQKQSLNATVSEFERKEASPALQAIVDMSQPNLEQWEAEAMAVIDELGREILQTEKKE